MLIALIEVLICIESSRGLKSTSIVEIILIVFRFIVGPTLLVLITVELLLVKCLSVDLPLVVYLKLSWSTWPSNRFLSIAHIIADFDVIYTLAEELSEIKQPVNTLLFLARSNNILIRLLALLLILLLLDNFIDPRDKSAWGNFL
jgi:hypothetical protein